MKMNALEKLLRGLDSVKTEVPRIFGPVHLFCLITAALLIVWFARRKKKGLPARENLVFAVYGFVTLLLETTKQLMWALGEENGAAVWSYSWYAAPFQLCSMPMYVCILLCFVKKGRLREHLLSFLGFFSIVSMTLVLFYPGDCLTGSVFINLHTLFLHGGGFVVAVYVLLRRLTDFSVKSVLRGGKVFLVMAALALLLDVAVEKSGINHGNTFNMFYISPYYECTLPVLRSVWEAVPYPVFLLTYLASVMAGAFTALGIAKGLAKIKNR